MARVTGIDHVGIVTDNMNELIDFYCEVLGFKKLESANKKSTPKMKNLSQDT